MGGRSVGIGVGAIVLVAYAFANPGPSPWSPSRTRAATWRRGRSAQEVATAFALVWLLLIGGVAQAIGQRAARTVRRWRRARGSRASCGGRCGAPSPSVPVVGRPIAGMTRDDRAATSPRADRLSLCKGVLAVDRTDGAAEGPHHDRRSRRPAPCSAHPATARRR